MYRIIGADGQEYGPVTLEQLKKWQAENRVNAQTRVCAEGSPDWKTLADFPELMGTPAAVPPVPPGPVSLPQNRPAIPNYLVQSILVTLCCCMPLGIPAIVFAAQVNSKVGAGDIAGAQESSRKAKMWCWIAFGLGILSNLIVGAFYALAAAKGLKLN